MSTLSLHTDSGDPPVAHLRDKMSRHLLLVDDEEPVRRALGRYLTLKGFTVEMAADGSAALDLITRNRFALMISDIRMPGMSGQQLVEKALEIDPDLAIMMMSGVNDAGTATELLTKGVSDYLVKPVELDALLTAVERGIDKRNLRIETRKMDRLIRDTVVTRTVELEKEKRLLRELTIQMAETLINAMEAKDQFLRGHSQRVADLAASIAEQLGHEPEMVEHIRLAGRLHDVGIIGIREQVLNKPGPLTAEEYAHVKEHVKIGMEILAPLSHLGDILEMIHSHHEYLDGTGYPRQLQQSQINIGARILCIADAFDALTSRRAFRESMSTADALATMSQQVDRRFDRAAYEALCKLKQHRKSLIFLDESVSAAIEDAEQVAAAGGM